MWTKKRVLGVRGWTCTVQCKEKLSDLDSFNGEQLERHWGHPELTL